MHLCSLGWQSVFIAKWNQPYYPPVNHNAAGRLKDTATNLKSGQGFAMNIISEAFIENANVTAVDTPPEFDEWALSGLTKEKCVQNKSLARQGKREFFFKFWCIWISVTMIPVLWETLMWVPSVLHLRPTRVRTFVYQGTPDQRLRPSQTDL
ncbi:hypothetical protein C8R48DRAFT_765353 [Suillus tomentosus]|nr:hypothetical protein C8R48DRAFT_765353 [Suillus tomentosus]